MRRSPFAAAIAIAVALAAGRGRADEATSAAPAPAAAAVIVPEPAAPAAAPAAETAAAPAVPAPTDPAAATTAEPSPQQPALAEADAAPARLPRVGVGVGAGVPEFAALTVLYRPVPFLRLGAGPTWNYYGWGGHVGVALVPVNWWLTPVLAFEAGHYLRTNYSAAVKSGSASANDVRQLLAHVDYSYTAVDLGLEVGNPRGFSVSLRTGLAFVWVDARGTSTKRSDDGSTVTISNPALRATLPSTKLAFQYWF